MYGEGMTTTHTHQIAEDGDECLICGMLVCPDTLTEVGYDGDSHYWHLDGTTCFLHQFLRQS